MEIIPLEVQINLDNVVKGLVANLHDPALAEFIMCLACQKDDAFVRRLIVKLRGDVERQQVKGNAKVAGAIQFLKATLSEEDIELLRAML